MTPDGYKHLTHVDISDNGPEPIYHQLLRCTDCGSAVADTAAHDNWHRALDSMWFRP